MAFNISEKGEYTILLKNYNDLKFHKTRLRLQQLLLPSKITAKDILVEIGR